jgi:Domain of unknown function (DUF4167)
MRPSQQKNRMRGRGRKQPNPLSRNYESNGPDVKIRGNASHIAEKYAALARDASASGDRVMAENYLQHAEHYNRIIAAAAAAAGRNEENNAGRGPQPDFSAQDRFDMEDGEPVREGGIAEETAVPEAPEPVPVKVDDAGESPEAENRERREGRRRRTKRAEGNGAHAPNGDGGSAGQRDDDKQRITEDAARLPGNLIGAPPVAEAAEGKVAQDD